MAKRERGRPVEYKGFLAKALVKTIRQHGLTGAQALVAEAGIQVPVKVGSKDTVLFQKNVSLPTLGKLAKAAGVKLYRGRPAKVVVKVAA